MKHLVKKVSKSIQFIETDALGMEALAKELGFTRLQGEEERGDVSKVVQRGMKYILAHQAEFKQWTVSGNHNGKKADTKKDK